MPANHDIKVTFVNTEFNHEKVVKSLSDSDNVTEVVNMVSIKDGMEPWDDRNDFGKLTEAMDRVMPGELESLIEKINTKGGEQITRTQFEELALGLELTNRPFLWVVRQDIAADMDEAYPKGFKDSVHNRGRMVSWAPQQQVLSHPSVACFVSHCGWNSAIEGVSNGVPFVFGLLCDHLFNRSTFVMSGRLD
ncbi:hypothetical protein DH2020_048829 [Rehmannia glutinosa]|uniref:Uncharacterized protein n=1 Tax=Rehmannia glutinosa TaxID=99300 RepID=A0ABR0U5G7_REHGL